ncbi:MAG TPA: extracellular solute-binding protein [Acidimicrobiales bacterium]|nr:extracellular solute-binding protein [Acidimicrobiales bacterium]
MGGLSRRRFLQSAGALSALVLAGCGSSGTKKAVTTSTAAGGASLLHAKGNGVTIQVADYSYQQTGYKEAMDAVTAAFTKNTGAQVSQVAAPVAQYVSTVLTQLQAGSPPDVIRVDDPQLSTYISNGWLSPLDDVIAAQGLNLSDFVSAEDDTKSNGKLYGIVKESNPRIFIYNKALYDKAGVSAPTDLSSFEAAIRKTTDASSGQFGTAFDSKQGDATTFFIQLTPFLFSLGGNFFANGKPSATDPHTISAVEFIQKLWTDNLVPRGLDAVTVNNLVIQGKVAATINGAFVIVEAQKSNPAVAQHLQAIKNPLPGTNMRATAWWCVPTKAKNPELGKAYLAALLDKNVQQTFNADTGVIVARKDGISPQFVSSNPWFNTVVTEADDPTATLSYFPQSLGSKGSAAVAAAGTAVLQLLYAGGDVSKAMTQLQSQLESMVA